MLSRQLNAPQSIDVHHGVAYTCLPLGDVPVFVTFRVICFAASFYQTSALKQKPNQLLRVDTMLIGIR